MKGLALFAAGILVGVLATHTVTAQDSAPRALSHVGIAVKDFDATLAYYTKTLGFREAYSLKQPDGRPLLTYLHINRDTFLEAAAGHRRTAAGARRISPWSSGI